MQLVLSNNRVIAHGENFIPMGGTVINTETNKVYQNATIAECDNCPSDIGEVGYEYHAGVFKPCAPYGKGNNDGFFMEVCVPCATPRNSGIPINNIKFVKIAGIAVSCDATESSYSGNRLISISNETLSQYESLRYVIKKGSSIEFSDGEFTKEFKLYAGNDSESGFCLFSSRSAIDEGGVVTFEEDYEIQETFRVGREEDYFNLYSTGVSHPKNLVITTGKSTLSLSAKHLHIYAPYGSVANLDIEILGRKI